MHFPPIRGSKIAAKLRVIVKSKCPLCDHSLRLYLRPPARDRHAWYPHGGVDRRGDSCHVPSYGRTRAVRCLDPFDRGPYDAKLVSDDAPALHRLEPTHAHGDPMQLADRFSELFHIQGTTQRALKEARGLKRPHFLPSSTVAALRGLHPRSRAMRGPEFRSLEPPSRCGLNANGTGPYRAVRLKFDAERAPLRAEPCRARFGIADGDRALDRRAAAPENRRPERVAQIGGGERRAARRAPESWGSR